MRGPDDGQMRVALREGSGIRLADFRERLRKALPERLMPWFTDVLRKRRHARRARPQQRARQMTFGFEPGDIVSEVMSFGSPTPIEIVAVQPRPDRRPQAYAEKVAGRAATDPVLRDVQIQQTLDYPTVPITIDRQKAGLSGVDAEQVGQSVLVATSSSRMVARNYWQDPKTGVSYQVQVQVPIAAHGFADPGGDGAAGAGRRRHQPDGPRRGQRGQRLHARRVRPHVHAALPEHHRQRRGRGPGPGRPAGRRGPRAGRHSRRAASTSRTAARSPHERDVRVAGHRPGRGRGRHPRAADRLFPVAAPGPGLASAPCPASSAASC